MSGIGITTSISKLSYFFKIILPSESPILSLVLWTEIESIVESGLEKYTNSNRQGECGCPRTIFFLIRSPFSPIMIACPGSISFKKSNPNAVKALLSDATIYEFFFLPSASGLIPFASRNAIKPIPATTIVTAKPP